MSEKHLSEEQIWDIAEQGGSLEEAVRKHLETCEQCNRKLIAAKSYFRISLLSLNWRYRPTFYPVSMASFLLRKRQTFFWLRMRIEFVGVALSALIVMVVVLQTPQFRKSSEPSVEEQTLSPEVLQSPPPPARTKPAPVAAPKVAPKSAPVTAPKAAPKVASKPASKAAQTPLEQPEKKASKRARSTKQMTRGAGAPASVNRNAAEKPLPGLRVQLNLQRPSPSKRTESVPGVFTAKQPAIMGEAEHLEGLQADLGNHEEGTPGPSIPDQITQIVNDIGGTIVHDRQQTLANIIAIDVTFDGKNLSQFIDTLRSFGELAFDSSAVSTQNAIKLRLEIIK